MYMMEINTITLQHVHFHHVISHL